MLKGGGGRSGGRFRENHGGNKGGRKLRGGGSGDSSPSSKLFLEFLKESSRDLISMSFRLGAFASNLFKTSFLPMSIFQIREPITVFCVSNFDTSLTTSSSGFSCLMTFFALESRFCQKLTSLSLPFCHV